MVSPLHVDCVRWIHLPVPVDRNARLLLVCQLTCSAFHGDVPMYRDDNHLSFQGALLFTSLLWDGLNEKKLGAPLRDGKSCAKAPQTSTGVMRPQC
jgi:hypothetical protein